MTNKNLRTIEISALAVSIIVTVLAMLRSAAWQIDSGTFLFILWAVSPYICLFLADFAIKRTSLISKMLPVFCTASVLMLAFTLLAYVGTLGDDSSTYALIFLFVPLYLFIGAVIFCGGGLIWTLLSKPSIK